ncbi:heparan-alpha-glucosaminide N-acetyltransferase domain-containing protein [Mucilaginibacter sp.]|uniref:DUF1624 domain-containing protein n=1 Tax=Mucilaginibacter sp. TaxID=1882438 RepID=UPI00262C5241|nr:heparan-alpha-glucosaminide N-acetyltransferase domain-containing protein [Mucilaginibacter sp.]MDB5029994.1 hypothetical protein [Mucilaginibacter sp.]
MATTISATTKHRIESIDILRGLVMLIMAIDHVRDVFHLGQPEPTNLAITTPILFFTRWITHFCAPTFVFLSGMSAYLAGMRRTRNELSVFLIKRGLWLIVVEVVFITFAITLNPLYNVLILQVIWAIGGSMVLLGLLVRLKTPLTVIGIIGAIIFFGHNILDIVNPGPITATIGWKLFLSAAGFNGFVQIGSNHYVLIAYALLPWTGVMLLGYVFGSLYKSSVSAVKRRKTLLYSGLGLLALFLIFRAFNIYGDPSPWSVQKTTALSIISFLNTTKYPCSLLYLSMTIGPSLVLLASIETVKNRFTSIIIVYGNVPFFYYVCHWYLIQTIHVIVFFAKGYSTSQIVNPKIPFLFSPAGFGFNLLGVYLIWLVVIVILYLPCRWFSKYKKTHQQWWLSYI